MRPASPSFDTWSAFLLILFGIVGLCGLFASYANSIPLERALARSTILDQVAATDGTRAALDRFRPALDSLTPVLDAPGPLAARIAAARVTVTSEQEREAASIGYRTRLMLGVITVIAAALGVGILALARRQTGR